jgi:hypothetical protein
MNEQQLRNQIKKIQQKLLFETDPVKEKQMEILVESLMKALDFEANANKEEKDSESETEEEL